ncbi:unnamed protein product [Arctia plantaginis]|uniref:Transposable element P transposase-like GTP-binding insertion domain-containing protein n=1 Tax=Arctia plantaginis TaxID=874455 RepID=A0A8S1ATZ1_ARCPL|nr:unnamed protein product [Arctia plantaginis]
MLCGVNYGQSIAFHIKPGASVENPYIEVRTSDNKQGIGIAKWSHIRQFYELDNNNPNFVYAPLLTKEHVDPNTKQKMRVKLAAQVLSHSVAAGIFSKIAKGDMPTGAVATASNVVIVVLEDVAVTRTINTRGRNHPVEAAIPIELESRKQRKAVAATGKC